MAHDLGRGQREHKPPQKLKDYVLYNTVCNNNTPHVSTDSASAPLHTVQGNTLYPLHHYISDDLFSPGHQVFLAAVLAGVEPKSYREAMEHEVWHGAVDFEIEALEANGTWSIVDLPPGKEALGNQWIFKLKYNADGTLERHKARLVVLGNHQVEGEDFDETFAPVAKMTIVRNLLAIVSAKKWEVYQMDVHNAFLHGDLDEEVYMKLPLGFRGAAPGKVCRLHKSLYGLKQAPRCCLLNSTLH